MHARLTYTICAALVVLPVRAAIVDRTAITVGPKVITDSEIVRRIRLTAFQNGLLPNYADTSRRDTAQRLIDLKLVEREMDIGHYARTSPDRAKALLDAFTAEHFRSSPEALRLALAGLDLTPADLQAEFAEQADLLSFTTQRFLPAVEISDQEIEEYFHSHIETKAAGVPVSLGDVRANIQQILSTERADLNLDTWLRDQRAHTKITYLEKELQ